MASLWTDNDHGAHPWVAGRLDGAAPPEPTRSAPDRTPDQRPVARPAVIAGACAAAAIAGGLLVVLL